LYNLHALKDLLQWKRTCSSIRRMVIIGEFEMLNSLANLSFNNPDFVFPDIKHRIQDRFQKP
jgi:hypothetical protein